MWLTLVNIGTGATCRIIYAVYRSCVVLAEGAGGWQPPKTRPPVWWPATYLGWDAQAKQNRDFPNPWRGQWPFRASNPRAPAGVAAAPSKCGSG